MIRKFFVSLALALLSTGLLFAQRAADDKQTNASSGIDVFGGAMFLSGETSTAGIFGGNVWTTLNCGNRPWCFTLQVPVWWRGPIKDPWKRMPPIFRFPFPFPFPPEPDPWNNFPLEELELGNTLTLAPSLGLRFGGADSRLSFEIFGGGGFQHIQGNSTLINQQTFRTTSTTAPLLTYGASARMGIGGNISAKLEFRALTTFEKDLSVFGPEGSMAIFEGMTMTMPMISAGIGIGL